MGLGNAWLVTMCSLVYCLGHHKSSVCSIVSPTLLSVPETHGCLCSVQGRAWSQPVDQFSIPDAANHQYVPDRLNVSLHFTSQSWLTVADGTGRLYMLHTGDRRSTDKWKVNFIYLFFNLYNYFVY